MSRFKLLYFVIFIINLYKVNAQISDKRLCVDEKCEVPISLAKTLLRYSSPDSRILSFAPNVDLTIYSKSAGSREDLWGAEINGKRGYIPKHMVRETKVLQKPTLLVDTEFSNETETKQVPSKVEPDKVQQAYEVIDGTTIYLNPQEEIIPSSTESPIQTTALPPGTDKITENKAPLEEEKIVETAENSAPEKQEESAKVDEVSSNKEKDDETGKNVDEDGQETVTSGAPTEQEKQEVEEEDDEEEEEEDDGDVDVEGDEDEESEEDDVEVGKTVTENTEELNNQNTNAEPEITAEIHTTKDTESETPPNSLEQKELPESTEQLTETIKSELEENKILTDSSPSPLVSNILSVQKESEEVLEDTSANTTDLDDVTTLPTVEVTSVSPELEVPQPLDDNFIEVTPNPLEVVKEPVEVKESIIPSLPPLSLFEVSTASSIAESSENNIASENNSDVQSGETNVETPESISSIEAPGLEDVVESKEDVEADVNVAPFEDIQVEKPPENVADENNKQSDLVQDADPVIEGDKDEQSYEEKQDSEENAGPGFFSSALSMLGLGSEENAKEEIPVENVKEEIPVENAKEEIPVESEEMKPEESKHLHTTIDKEQYCDATSCETSETTTENSKMDLFNFNPDIFLYLVTTAISIIIFLFGYIAFDKCKREGPLVAKINSLEKQLLIVIKENQLLQEKLSTDSGYETNDKVPNEVVESLKQELNEMSNIKNALEEQVQSLEKELENSTEVGMELNKMLSEILSSENGSDVIKSNVEHLQRQLVEQQSTINSVNETLAVTNTENHELRLELELSNKKVVDLQAELDKLLLNILKIEEEKEAQQATLESEITNYRQKYEETNKKLILKEEEYIIESKQLKNRVDQTERKLELKIKEYDVLKETLKQLKNVKNNDDATLKNLLEVGGIKAELQLLKSENQRFSEKLQQEQELKSSYEKRAQSTHEELEQLKKKYDEADKLRVETQTKLEVLTNYFKDREAQWQKEISKHEALWAEKEGEATSTTERIKFMQEQLQNYKVQTESLKQEIMSQEIELKSQISVLEKKAHENWVSARQAERKLEEAKQEAAQLRHRLTLRERAIQEDKNQHRLQSTIEQNGDMPVSPLESPASPPLLYGTRDHITKSPPIPGLPPFLPPPPGVPFMPPPIHGVPPFIPPPPPNMFPGDHRPPPLGRMSSPPLNSRYSPSSMGYSPYDRNSSSPSDSEYGTSPPHRRAYSPFNNRDDRRDYKRPPPGRANGRNLIKGGASSGSGNSNESLEKISRQQSKV